MDANTYYLNQYLGEIEARDRWQTKAQEYAQEQVEDERGAYYPWTEANVYEALGEISSADIKRIVAAKNDDKELAQLMREILVGYWFNYCEEKFLDSDPIDWEDV